MVGLTRAHIADPELHDPLSADLLKAGLTVQVIGDARIPGTILTAIAQAHSIDFGT